MKYDNVVIADGFATISWHEPEDKDGDLAGYYVFISDESRGWQEPLFDEAADILPYRSDAEIYGPQLYDIYFTLPMDYERYDVTQPQITFSIEQGRDYYISVSAYDTYGKTLDREYFVLSNELKITA